MRPIGKTRQDLPPHQQTMTAGQMRHRITLQVPTEAADTAGQPIPSWADNSTVWGSYQQTGGSEVVVGEQTRSFITGTVTVRANTVFTPKRRLKINGSGLTNLIVNISAVQPPDPDSGLQLLIVEQPADGIVQ